MHKAPPQQGAEHVVSGAGLDVGATTGLAGAALIAVGAVTMVEALDGAAVGGTPKEAGGGCEDALSLSRALMTSHSKATTTSATALSASRPRRIRQGEPAFGGIGAEGLTLAAPARDEGAAGAPRGATGGGRLTEAGIGSVNAGGGGGGGLNGAVLVREGAGVRRISGAGSGGDGAGPR